MRGSGALFHEPPDESQISLEVDLLGPALERIAPPAIAQLRAKLGRSEQLLHPRATFREGFEQESAATLLDDFRQRTDPARDTATQLFWDEVFRRVRAMREA